MSTACNKAKQQNRAALVHAEHTAATSVKAMKQG
jgi:hypothetical protein